MGIRRFLIAPLDNKLFKGAHHHDPLAVIQPDKVSIDHPEEILILRDNGERFQVLAVGEIHDIQVTPGDRVDQLFSPSRTTDGFSLKL